MYSTEDKSLQHGQSCSISGKHARICPENSMVATLLPYGVKAYRFRTERKLYVWGTSERYENRNESRTIFTHYPQYLHCTLKRLALALSCSRETSRLLPVSTQNYPIAAMSVQPSAVARKAIPYMVLYCLTPPQFHRYSSLTLCPPYPARGENVGKTVRCIKGRNPPGK